MANNGYSTGANLAEFEEKIKADLSQGNDLVDVAYGDDGTWVATFQDTSNNTGYITASNADELGQKVQEEWAQGGYRLTDVEYGEALRCGGSLRCSKC